MREGILTKEPPYNKLRGTKIQNDKRRPPIKKSPVPSLRYLELQITDRCNLRCRHCYIDTNSISKLSLRGGRRDRRSNLKKIATPFWLAMTDKDITSEKVKASELSVTQIKNILTEFRRDAGLKGAYHRRRATTSQQV